MQQRDYKLGVTLWKAGWSFINNSLGIGAGVLAISPPEKLSDLKDNWPVILVPLGIAVIRAGRNWWKFNKNKEKRGRYIPG